MVSLPPVAYHRATGTPSQEHVSPNPVRTVRSMRSVQNETPPEWRSWRGMRATRTVRECVA